MLLSNKALRKGAWKKYPKVIWQIFRFKFPLCSQGCNWHKIDPLIIVPHSMCTDYIHCNKRHDFEVIALTLFDIHWLFTIIRDDFEVTYCTYQYLVWQAFLWYAWLSFLYCSSVYLLYHWVLHVLGPSEVLPWVASPLSVLVTFFSVLLFWECSWHLRESLQLKKKKREKCFKV